jgi:hypothetical protein
MRPASRALRPPLPDFNRITPGSPFPAILGCRAMTMEHDDKEAVPDAAPEGAIPPPEAGAPPVQEQSDAARSIAINIVTVFFIMIPSLRLSL